MGKSNKACNENHLGADEASLIWDEYKYRHALIWKHLIRSTTAVVALLTVQFLTDFNGETFLIFASFIIAIGYTVFTIWILGPELDLLKQVKEEHRKRQKNVYPSMHKNDRVRIVNFQNRVRFYIYSLLILSIAAAAYYLFRVCWFVIRT